MLATTLSVSLCQAVCHQIKTPFIMVLLQEAKYLSHTKQRWNLTNKVDHTVSTEMPGLVTLLEEEEALHDS